VIFDNSLKMMQALQENETVFDLMTYPGEPHGLRQVHNRKHFLKTMMAFFNVHLSPDVSPADTTGGQDDDTN
jgi:dipeptidyl-peptidase-4